jgi:hypothetical protein
MQGKTQRTPTAAQFLEKRGQNYAAGISTPATNIAKAINLISLKLGTAVFTTG